MTDTVTAENIDVAGEGFLAASGDWEFTPDLPPPAPRRWSRLRFAAIPLVLAASSTTFGSDPWAPREEAPTTLASPFDPIETRRISLAEARRIALKTLEEAEAERLRVADEEAARGIDWEQTV